LLQPEGGASYHNPIRVREKASAEVATVGLFGDGGPVGERWAPEAAPSLWLPKGTQSLELVAYDSAGQPVASDQATFQMLAPEVTFVAPGDEAWVSNPVSFVLATAGIDQPPDRTMYDDEELRTHYMKIPVLTLLFPALLTTSCKPLRMAMLLNDYEITLADASPEDTTATEVRATTDAQGKRASILAAFFGLDDDLPRFANRVICEGAGGKDGMPVIFSHEIDSDSMQAGDFRVTTASGNVGELTCVTLAPADDPGELRTVLLTGQYGSINDQPVKVEIVGNLLSLDKSLNFKGTSSTVIPLEDGPTLILAELVAQDRLELGKAPTELPFGGGSGCPVDTRQVVNVVWAGGVTKPEGNEADDQERLQYAVIVENTDGSQAKVTPFALADLQDGDNNHRLCLDVAGRPTSVFFPAGHLADPRGDLNPDTRMAIRPSPSDVPSPAEEPRPAVEVRKNP
jgi:hypothetical protein